jgi:hypothetical protein
VRQAQLAQRFVACAKTRQTFHSYRGASFCAKIGATTDRFPTPSTIQSTTHVHSHHSTQHLLLDDERWQKPHLKRERQRNFLMESPFEFLSVFEDQLLAAKGNISLVFDAVDANSTNQEAVTVTAFCGASLEPFQVAMTELKEDVVSLAGSALATLSLLRCDNILPTPIRFTTEPAHTRSKE